MRRVVRRNVLESMMMSDIWIRIVVEVLRVFVSGLFLWVVRIVRVGVWVIWVMCCSWISMMRMMTRVRERAPDDTHFICLRMIVRMPDTTIFVWTRWSTQRTLGRAGVVDKPTHRVMRSKVRNEGRRKTNRVAFRENVFE